jgi:NAD-dependent DNA ligase
MKNNITDDVVVTEMRQLIRNLRKHNHCYYVTDDPIITKMKNEHHLNKQWRI